MRFAIHPVKLESLNSFKEANFIEINQGETIDFYFQLIDKDKDGLRYIPAAGATVYVEIPRFPDNFGTITNDRLTVDYSVRRNAVEAFPSDDRSLWKLVLIADDTQNMMSSDIRVTLTEGSKISKTLFIQGIKVIPREGAPQ